MLRALFLLTFVGGALYATLIATHSALSSDDTDEYFYVLAIRSPVSDAAAGTLRSWGSNLQSLRNVPLRAVPASRPAADPDNRPVSAGLAVAAASSQDEEAIGWAKVALAARGHGEASVSSPTVHFYRAGTELEIVGRDGAWLKLRDAATKEQGWVFEKYVSLIDGPSATHVAASSPAQDAPIAAAATEPAPPKAKPVKATAAKFKKPGRNLKPTIQAPDLATATLDPRRGQFASRGERRGLGLFLFGRRMAKIEAEGRVATR
jgi:hypothetical protein